ncbi:MAG: hypothetical protein EXR66_06120 [Dehalococcoidia bacterium]|nr:hypothetical protein [Dehalococcoidia bacterium]
MATGRWNVGGGFLFISGFVILGFVLVYLRDFAPGKAEWIASSDAGKHFETRLAPAHGNLFALLNIAIGLVLPKLALGEGGKRALAWLGIIGMLMPLGILAEVTLGVPPFLVLLGGASMFIAVTWTGIA